MHKKLMLLCFVRALVFLTILKLLSKVLIKISQKQNFKKNLLFQYNINFKSFGNVKVNYNEICILILIFVKYLLNFIQYLLIKKANNNE